MAITDPTIDPVTGLPILDTSGIVQQIPLGRQTVDYAGWYATAQPTRSPLSPDDVIPVFANVQGQHPQTENAQSVHTDGNNALLVKDVNPSGGGTIISPNYSKGPSDQLDAFNSPSFIISGPLTGAELLYSVDISVVLDPNVGGIPPVVGYGDMSFYVQDHTGVVQFYLSTLPFYWNGTMNQSVVSGHYHQDWPVGISFIDMGMPPGFRPELWFISRNGPYRLLGQWQWFVP